MKKIILLILIIVSFDIFIYPYIKSKNCNIEEKIKHIKNPLTKNLFIKNINIDDIEMVSAEIYAKDADTIKYPINKKFINRYGNGIKFPIKYLIADKVSSITINIKYKNGESLEKKYKIKTFIRNNKNFFLSDSLPDFKIKKRANNLKPVIYLFELIIITPEDKQLCLMIGTDSYGNIRQISEKPKIKLNKNIQEKLNSLKFQINQQYSIDDSNLLFILGNIREGQNKTLTKKEHKNILDILLIINKKNNKIENIIDFKSLLDNERSCLTNEFSKENPNANDWLHPNSIAYDKEDNSILISSRYQGIFKIDTSGELKWILSPHKYWKEKYIKYLLIPINSNDEILSKEIQLGDKNYSENNDYFEWCWGQHSVSILDDGNILVFDNGFKRNFNNDLNRNDLYSRAVIYKINSNKKNIKQIWQYGKELSNNFFSIAKGTTLAEKNNEIVVLSGLIIDKKNLTSKAIMKKINYTTNEILLDIDIHFKNKYRNKLKLNAYYDAIFDITIANSQ